MELSRSEAERQFGDENVHPLPEGGFIIAGEYFEPLRQEQCVLVEQAPADLLANDDGAARLMSWARRTFPDARYVIRRDQELDSHLAGFDDFSYYVALESSPISAEHTDDISVRTAEPRADREKVAFWLVQAFEDAVAMRSETGPDGAARAQAEAVLDDEDARSFLAVHDGTEIGHVTLLVDQQDDLTGQEFIELLDVLVEPTHPHRHVAEAALVQHAWEFAKADGKPLVGHVVVRDKPGPGGSIEQMILERLRTRGWTYTHKFQIADLTAR